MTGCPVKPQLTRENLGSVQTFACRSILKQPQSVAARNTHFHIFGFGHVNPAMQIQSDPKAHICHTVVTIYIVIFFMVISN